VDEYIDKSDVFSSINKENLEKIDRYINAVNNGIHNVKVTKIPDLCSGVIDICKLLKEMANLIFFASGLDNYKDKLSFIGEGEEEIREIKKSTIIAAIFNNGIDTLTLKGCDTGPLGITLNDISKKVYTKLGLSKGSGYYFYIIGYDLHKLLIRFMDAFVGTDFKALMKKIRELPEEATQTEYIKLLGEAVKMSIKEGRYIRFSKFVDYFKNKKNSNLFEEYFKNEKNSKFSDSYLPIFKVEDALRDFKKLCNPQPNR
jgi:hypothetical protein